MNWSQSGTAPTDYCSGLTYLSEHPEQCLSEGKKTVLRVFLVSGLCGLIGSFGQDNRKIAGEK